MSDVLGDSPCIIIYGCRLFPGRLTTEAVAAITIYETTYYYNNNIILYCDYDNAPAVPQVVVARPCPLQCQFYFPVYCCTTHDDKDDDDDDDDIIAHDECFIIIFIIIAPPPPPPVRQDFRRTKRLVIDDRGTRYSGGSGAGHRVTTIPYSILLRSPL